ncbi:MAG TPA: CHAT domain-containing protein [Allocoleopsis sp.]
MYQNSTFLACNSLRQYPKAISFYLQSLEIYRKLNNRQGEANALFNLGVAYSNQRKNQEAIKHYQQSLAIYREISNRQWEAKTLNNLGNVYADLGQYQKAIDLIQQSLVIKREINDRLGEVYSFKSLGAVYETIYNFPREVEFYQQSLTLAKELNNRPMEADILIALGRAYKNLGNYGKAIDLEQQGLTLCQEISNLYGEADALNELGLVYNRMGNYEQAINYLQQSLAIAKKPSGHALASSFLGNLAQVYINIGDYNKGNIYAQQALKIAQDNNDLREEGADLGELGVVNIYLGNLTRAIEFYQQYLTITRKIENPIGEAIALDGLGYVYRLLGDYPQAIKYGEQSLVISRKIEDQQGVGISLDNLGNALYESGNFAAAERTLMEGIKVFESLRARVGSNDENQVSIFETQADIYRTLQQVLIAENQTGAALEIAERGRARAFVELLARRLSPNPIEQVTITLPTIEQIKQISNAENVTLVEYSLVEYQSSLQVQMHPAQSSSQTSTEKIAVRFHRPELYIWVISPTGEVTFRRSDLKPLWQKQNTTLADLVNTSRDSIGVRGLPIIGFRPRPGFQQRQEASLTEQLQQLHKLLIEPITDLLPTNPDDRVIFIPQGSLFLVPFPALQDKDGKYLIEKHTILTAPSIQVLQLTREQRQREGTKSRSLLQGNDALVVGNPTMPSVPPEPGEKPQQLPSLPGAETEAKAIADVLHTKPLIGNQATKSAVEQLMSKARIIHLATHGLLDDVRGLGSAIALAPDSSYKDEIGKVNGLLTAEEILDLKLNAELVVLSACNTGRGKITGDGVIGLSRSLISAGVPSVLVSLWSVPDAPTAQLMSEFYQNLQKNPDKAQALRQAMLTIMKQHPNPKDWAAFTLIGESN